MEKSHKLSGLSKQEFLDAYRREWEFVLRFFLRRTFHPEVGADLTAETFAKAFLARSRFDSALGDTHTWLLGIARNELNDYLRHLDVQRRAQDRLGLPVRSLSPDDYERVEELIDFAELGRDVRAALSKLSADQRQAVILRIVDRLSYDEISERLHCTPESARSRVSRGLRALGTALATSDPRPKEA